MEGSLFGIQIMTAQEMASKAMQFFQKYTLTLIGSVIIVVFGWLAAILVGRWLRRMLLKRNADVTITKFLVQIVEIFIVAVAILLSLGNFGITIAPFIAGLSVIGLGASFALQGPLSNYAAGATLVFTKPFKVGDIMEIGDWIGQVEDMTLARTLIKTLDGTRVVIPNKKIIGEVIHNYSDYKRLDIKVGIGYNTDVDKAVSLVKGVIAGQKMVSQKPQPKVGISEFADSSIIVYARVWCRQQDYWDLMFAVNKDIYDEFRKNGIAIPFPQRDVRIFNETKGV
jgi:small conductance mechanosensitive channel